MVRLANPFPVLLSMAVLALGWVATGCREPLPSPDEDASTLFRLEHPQLGEVGQSRVEWSHDAGQGGESAGVVVSDDKDNAAAPSATSHRILVEHTRFSVPQGKQHDIRMHADVTHSRAHEGDGISGLHLRIQRTVGRDRVDLELTSSNGEFEWVRRTGMRVERRGGVDSGIRGFVVEPKLPQETDVGALTPFLLLARELAMERDNVVQHDGGHDNVLEAALDAPGGTDEVENETWIEFPVHQLRDGRPTRLRLQQREARRLRVGDRELTARRFYVQVPASGHTLWVDPTGELLGVDGLFGGFRAVRQGFEWPEPISEVTPIDVREEEVATETDSAHLEGTLSFPRQGTEPVPGVVLIHGSGSIDRDASPMMFLRDLAHGLSSAGFAVVRYDKRGVGQSRITDPTASLALQTFADDAAAWFDVLARRSDVDSSCLVVVGHSEGAYLAPLAAKGDSRAAAVVMLAGPVDNLGAVLPDQLALIAGAHDVSAEEKEQLLRIQDASFRSILAPTFSLDKLPKNERGTYEWLKSHLEHDSAEVLRAMTAPVLALYAGGDLQVPVSQADRMRELIPSLPRGSQVVVLEDLDHVFMDPQGMPGLGSIFDPDRRIDSRMVSEIVRWLGQVPCVSSSRKAGSDAATP